MIFNILDKTYSTLIKNGIGSQNNEFGGVLADAIMMDPGLLCY